MTAKISLSQTAYAHGDTIRGYVEWQTAEIPRSAEIRLFWQTRGKGTSDSETVAVEKFELLQSHDERPFFFEAPIAPSSFSGTLVSIVWGLELVVEPGGSVASDLVIAPDGREIQPDESAWIEIPEPGATEPGPARIR